MPLDAANHPAIALKGGFRVQAIKGTVRAIGQSRVHMSGHTYAYVTFDLNNGSDFMLENVVVLNRVGSELEPGAAGTFHVVSNKRATSLIAFQAEDGRSRDDVAAFQKSIRSGNLGIIFFLVTAWVVVSGFAGLILMALFRHAPFFVWVLYYIAPPVLIFRHVMKRIPSEAGIRAAIAASAV